MKKLRVTLSVVSLILFVILSGPVGFAQTKDTITPKIKSYLGKQITNVGIVYYDLTTGQKIAINENKVFTAASTYKVGMNIVAYDMANSNKLKLTDGIQYNSKYLEGGTGILQGQIKTTLKKPVSIQKLLDYSIIYSDNIATNMISAKLGGSSTVRKTVLKTVGIKNFETSSNKISPEIEFRLLKRLYENRKNKNYAHLIDDMKKTTFHDRIDKYVPKNIVAHKIGNYGSYTHDVGIIFTKKPYILVVYTYNLPNAAEKIANISKIVYNEQLKK